MEVKMKVDIVATEAKTVKSSLSHLVNTHCMCATACTHAHTELWELPVTFLNLCWI